MIEGTLSCSSGPGALTELLLSAYYIQGNRLVDKGREEVGGDSKDEHWVLPCWSSLYGLDNVFTYFDTLNWGF